MPPYADLPSGGTTTEVAGVPMSESARFFAVIEKDEPGATTPRVLVFLIAGQSNGDGRADPAGLPTSPVNLQLPQDDVDFFFKAGLSSPVLTTLRPGESESDDFGPEITFGRGLADELGEGAQTRIALIKYAKGGTNLYDQWAGGGDGTTNGDGSQYLIFQNTVTAGLAALAAAHPDASIEVRGMLWVQGESDTAEGETIWNAYEANLTNFIGDIRATYGADLPFLVVRLSNQQTVLDPTGLAVVRAAQQAVAESDPFIDWIDTDGFGMKEDDLHFDAIGQQQIGDAAAAAILPTVP